MEATKSNIFTRILPVRLTDREVQALGEANAKDLEELSAKRLQLKLTSQVLQADIKALESNVFATGRKIRLGYEDRKVDCQYENYDFVIGTKEIVRLDTREKIGSEGVTEQDRERPLLVFQGEGEAIGRTEETKH